MKVLIMLIGLPKSGKSTWAIEHNNNPIVNPDSIRLALHGHKYIQEAESFVWSIAKCMVKALFLSGHNVVVLDATNITQKRRDEWLSPDWTIEHKIFDTSKEECINRALNDNDLDIIPVIERMSTYMELPSGSNSK